MKNLFNTFFLATLLAFSPLCAIAADSPQKNEMRSAWVATVWQLDWPSNVVSSTGNTAQINSQKNDMIRLLDSLHVNNLNAINFQIRSRCDAMYKSSYEPWSTDLVSKRGLDPGYDPLAFVVEECHKRGMECHAWINPYRYESITGQWSGGAGDYRKEHPDWIMDVGGAAILNPGKPEVTQRICDIIDEIITNYDVDGVLFDDYFYLSGTTDNMDADLYNAYKEEGGTLSQGDWRRDNVNRMVASVYKTIKAKKPYVRFGVAPAGIACTSQQVAKSYGISQCPTGSDWQYSSIFSDPIAWISQQSLDFISPQIYWTIGYSTDYDKATKWWSEVAAKWNRHMYVSHDIATLNKSSKAPGMSTIENQLNPLASGPNNTTFEEYANEIRLNREYTLNQAPGSIFYSCKYLYNNAPLFAHYLKTTVFNTPALMPAMSWLPVNNPGTVSGLKRAGASMSWDSKQDMRYTVYAVPTSVPQSNFDRDAEYLLGVTYNNTYTLPDRYLSGYNYAVCVYDRYGNEYSPMFVGAQARTLEAPVLVSPVKGESVEQPFTFQWKEVTDATGYVIEISDKADMSNLLYVKGVSGTECSSSEFYKMPIETPLYWRVRSCGNNFNDGVSNPEAFTSLNLEITYPTNTQVDVALCPEIAWTFADRDVTIQISKKEDFDKNNIVFQAEAQGGKFTLPKYILAYYSTYYARLLYTKQGEQCVTETVAFTTVEGVTATPQIVHPQGGGSLCRNDYITLGPVEGHTSLRIEVSATSDFPARSIYAQSNVDTGTFMDTKCGEEIKLGSTPLEDGKTYYVRARATYNTAERKVDTDYSDIVSFTYSSKDNSVITVNKDESNSTTKSYDLTGRPTRAMTPGIYITRKGNTTSKILVK